MTVVSTICNSLNGALALALILLVALTASAQNGASNGEWHHYAGDHGSTKYSALDQINRDNFDQIKPAWRWESIDINLDGKTQFKPFYFRGTPIYVDGVLYMSTGLHQVAAIDATDGSLIWGYDTEAYAKGNITHSMWHHRGVEYWTDGTEERIFISTGGRQLVSIDAKTGKPDPNFGNNGKVDHLNDLGRPVNARNISDNKPPIVVGDTVVIGSIIMDFPSLQLAPPGHIRGYDVRTGKLKWRFNTIPQAGEVGNETWLNDSWKKAGNTNVWSLMTADDELGYLYLPIGTPTNDYYGGHRPGDNLFAESLLCLDAETGKKVWHFQAVHHGIWDYDFPCAPNLVDITVDGKKIKAVAQVSKQGFTYVFNRVTGEPIWPIEERPVPASWVPGEMLSKSQPFPTKPPPFEVQGLTDETIIDFTPELRAEALKILEDYTYGPLFTPNTVAGEDGKQGTLVLPGASGGANWPGASVDPETGILYVQSASNISVMALAKPDAARSDFTYSISFGRVEGPQGLPLTKPPYRRITAIDLNKGEHTWQIPFGEGPTNHPAIKDMNLGNLGTKFQEGVIAEGGLLVTKTLLIGFLPILDELGDRVATGSLLQAFDKATGELLHSLEIDTVLHGSPMTYMHGGKQFIVFSAGGGSPRVGGDPLKSELLAFALPSKL